MGTYKSDLFDDMDAVDVLVTILCEGAVSHHGVLGAIVSVVDGDYHREIVLD